MVILTFGLVIVEPAVFENVSLTLWTKGAAVSYSDQVYSAST